MDILTFYQSHKINKDFDEILYQSRYPETLGFYQPYCNENNIDDKHRLYFHYHLYGKQTKANGGFNRLIDFYLFNRIDESFDEVLYQSMYPETKDFYQPECRNNNIDEKHRLYFHFKNYNRNAFQKIEDYCLVEECSNISSYGVHLFPYESTELQDVSARQSTAINSYVSYKIPEIQIISFGKNNPNVQEIEYVSIKDINYQGIKCDRDYYFLGDILEYGLAITKPDDYIIYTNSDCFIKDKFYSFILTSSYEYIEFFRLETTNDRIIGQNKDGIDGFAIKHSLLQKLFDKNILPKALILGAPYWDAIVSSIARKYIDNKYQDTSRLYHTKHIPRWSFGELDYAGKHNLSILNKLYDSGIINCRKAEIKSDNLVIRVFDSKTNFLDAKKIISNERFGSNRITIFDYNYLFLGKDTSFLTDENLGTTAGTRYVVDDDNIQSVITEELSKYKRYVILEENQQLCESTQFIPSHKDAVLGIVLCFFGNDDLRIKSVKRAMMEFQKQTIWKKSKVVFVELIDNDISNFNFSDSGNVSHLQIKSKESNKNLFQKECLWNIGANHISKSVDNFIFIDADTFPQNKSLFAKANKILRHDPNIVFQLGNCLITQKEDGEITRLQWLWNSFSKLKAKESYCFNPCGGFGISKKVFDQINGFNPYGLLYGGDILFLYEIDKRSRGIWNYEIDYMNIFKDMARGLDASNIIVKNEESPLIHCWHGDHGERAYRTWGLAFNELEFHKDEIRLDEDGLLSWSNDESQSKYNKFFENKRLITDIKAHRKLYL